MKLKFTEHPEVFRPITIEIKLETYEELQEWKQLIAYPSKGTNKAEHMRKKIADLYFQDN